MRVNFYPLTQMRALPSILLLSLFFSPVVLKAQLEKVVVETYYVSDDSDATDTTGSVLKAGSTTYRIYVDMKPGCKLKKMYGDANHLFKIASDSVFFNNTSEGETFGKDLKKNKLGDNTLALDSWLTLGQASTKSAGRTYFGILKEQDTDGSIIGGSNNDGGSKPVANGLLVNSDASAGKPLTTADGLDTMVAVPTGWLNGGIISISGFDSTIFGSNKPGTEFSSNNMYLANSGVSGVIPDSNQVLIAQLTTKGKISFELNLEIADAAGVLYKYVANAGVDSATTVLAPFLKYPPVCGCTDANYVEYNKNFACFDPTACKTQVVLGCTDPQACNYDPKANKNIAEMCCYPGLCADRDISVVCPALAVKELKGEIHFDLYPSPAHDLLSVKIAAPDNSKMIYSMYDAVGSLILEKNTSISSAENLDQFDISDLANGMYLFRVSFPTSTVSKKFVKN